MEAPSPVQPQAKSNQESSVNLPSMYASSSAVEVEVSEVKAVASPASVTAPPHRSRFAPYTSDEFGLFPDAEFAIEGLLPAQGIACVYGPAGAGKSALITPEHQGTRQ